MTSELLGTGFFAPRYFAGLLVGCLRGEKDKEKLLSPYYSPFPDDPDYWQREENQLVYFNELFLCVCAP